MTGKDLILSEYRCQGPETEDWLNAVFANRMPKAIGRSCLTPLVSKSGGIAGDFTVTRTGDDEFWIIGSGMAERYHKRFFNQIPLPKGTTFGSQTKQMCGFNVAGPDSRALLQSLTNTSLATADAPVQSELLYRPRCPAGNHGLPRDQNRAPHSPRQNGLLANTAPNMQVLVVGDLVETVFVAAVSVAPVWHHQSSLLWQATTKLLRSWLVILVREHSNIRAFVVTVTCAFSSKAGPPVPCTVYIVGHSTSNGISRTPWHGGSGGGMPLIVVSSKSRFVENNWVVIDVVLGHMSSLAWSQMVEVVSLDAVVHDAATIR